jgi:hypothetical protein
MGFRICSYINVHKSVIKRFTEWKINSIKTHSFWSMLFRIVFSECVNIIQII